MSELTLKELKAGFADVGIELPDKVSTLEMIEYYRSWEMAIVRRALKNLVPVVAKHGDDQLINDFRVLNQVALTHWKGHYTHEDNRIKSGRRGTDVLNEIAGRNELIIAEAKRLIHERGSDRGIAKVIKANLKSPLSLKQIKNIFKSEITS